jgi:3-oxoacyl-[acyl-carrier-protein] synthase-1
LSDAVAITGIGATTPVGVDAAQTCASLRAGLSRLSVHPSYFPIFADPIREPPERITCGLAAGDPDTLLLAERLVELGVSAMRDLVLSARLTRVEAQAADFMVCLSGPDRGGLPDADARQVVSELPRRLGLSLERQPILTLEARTGTHNAIAETIRRLQARQVKRCFVLAVDSLVCEPTLRWLDERDRLRSARNIDGFLPGEAAACLLLERSADADLRGAKALAHVTGVGFGREAHPRTGEANSTAQGLCEAIGSALGTDRAPGPWVVCDLNGESYAAYEWGLARTRLPELSDPKVSHVADCVGDVGSAAAALGIVVAARALSRGYAPARRVLVWSSSDGEQRAACALVGVS